MPFKPRRICARERTNSFGGTFPCGGTFKSAVEELVGGKWVLAANRGLDVPFRGGKMRRSPTRLECQHCGVLS